MFWRLVDICHKYIYTRSTHAYDASRHASRIQVGRAEQLSEIVHCWFSGSQKNNTWLVRTLQYVLSTFELFLVLFLLSWLPRWTDLFAFFFVRVASRRLRSALVSALDSTKYVRCEGPAALSSPSSIAKKRCLPNSVLHRCPRVMHVSVTPDSYVCAQIDIPSVSTN